MYSYMNFMQERNYTQQVGNSAKISVILVQNRYLKKIHETNIVRTLDFDF